MVNVGIDLHKTQFTICVRGLEGNRFAKYPTTEEGYQEFLKGAAVWQEAGEKVRAGVESTGNTRYFKNRMEDAGIGVTVINTLKFKIVNESVKKTDKHDAATILEFLEKDMLPESHRCSRTSEQLRRLLKVRATLVKSEVVIKNQIHALLSAEGMEDVKSGALQSKKGRKQTLDALNQCENGLVVQPLFETIEQLDKNVKSVEKQLRALTEGDRAVELLTSIPGCGEICAWTIRAYIDDIKRFANPKKFASFAGLAPWVQNSNETVRHGKITKRGPKELRTALVQVVMGMRRMQEKLGSWLLMWRYVNMKKNKGSGRAIIATARKVAVIIWHMLTNDSAFDGGKMVDRKLAEKSEAMRLASEAADETPVNWQEKPVAAMVEKKTAPKTGKKEVKKTGVAGKERKVG
jgi:transposase